MIGMILVLLKSPSTAMPISGWLIFNKSTRDGFKTQPPVDRRFRPVSIVLNNDNRPEPDGTAGQPVVGF